MGNLILLDSIGRIIIREIDNKDERNKINKFKRRSIS